MRPRWLALTAVILTLFSGCASPEGDQPRAAAPTSSSAGSTLPPSAASSSAATPSGPPPNSGPIHSLGDRARLVTGSKMTVFSWQKVQRPGPPAAGLWWAADVRFCLTRDLGDFQDPVENIRSQFRAELADGSPLTPEANARKSDELFAQPGQVVEAGQCRRGKVVFDIPTGQAAQYFAVTLSPFEWVRWQLT